MDAKKLGQQPINAIGPEGTFGFGNAGLTKREHFAAMAMQGLLANPGGPYQQSDMCGWRLVNCTKEQLSMECVDMADALLAELAREDE